MHYKTEWAVIIAQITLLQHMKHNLIQFQYTVVITEWEDIIFVYEVNVSLTADLSGPVTLLKIVRWYVKEQHPNAFWHFTEFNNTKDISGQLFEIVNNSIEPCPEPFYPFQDRDNWYAFVFNILNDVLKLVINLMI